VADMTDFELLSRVALALVLGLIIGLERGWKTRNVEDSHNIAGLRTYGLLGLLGGVWALISQLTSMLMLGFAFLGLSLVLIAAYFSRFRRYRDIGVTSVIAALLTFALGALAVLGHGMAAVSVAVIATLLLDLKPVLHGALDKLEPKELKASLKMLLISVVLLPILPNQGYGPWQALNPYTIWWMVVMITGISFLGYFAMKLGGTRRGALLTGLSGGLASSTAVTLSLSRLARETPDDVNAMASGILAACGTMFPRILLISTVLNPKLFVPLMWPTMTAAVVTYLAAFALWQHARSNPDGTSRLSNPFQLGMALRFSVFLAIILLLSKALREGFGDTGLYALAAISGLTDVDALTLSAARMSVAEISISVTVTAIIIAALTNTLIKCGFATYIGGLRLGLRVSLPLLGALLLAMCSIYLQG